MIQEKETIAENIKTSIDLHNSMKVSNKLMVDNPPLPSENERVSLLETEE